MGKWWAIGTNKNYGKDSECDSLWWYVQIAEQQLYIIGGMEMHWLIWNISLEYDTWSLQKYVYLINEFCACSMSLALWWYQQFRNLECDTSQ